MLCCLQDALFTRGTSATPDLPSAGKPRLPRGLFSPAGQRSGSASGGKVAARQGLLHNNVCSPVGPSAQDPEDDKLGSQPSGESWFMHLNTAGCRQCCVLQLSVQANFL